MIFYWVLLAVVLDGMKTARGIYDGQAVEYMSGRPPYLVRPYMTAFGKTI